ncbi:MAG TPA: ABC transporter ATP-binding protein [Mycobacteriales bacterium]|nr:ABC transporter ATP-binding protein [Mycobacteriales bacterium]
MTTTIEQQAAVSLREVSKQYGRGPGAVRALRGVTIDFRPGTFTAVMGPSGSGKSTLMHCAAGLDRPTSGSVHIGGTDLGGLKERALTKLRRERVGFVFQAFNLLPALTVQQNVTLPLRLAGADIDPAWVKDVLARVGLADKARRRPAELSGGQQQRVAIARGLITRPAVIVADEPTGALDSHTSAEVLQLLRGAVDLTGQTVLMVTHDPVAASYADQTVFLSDGRIAGELGRARAEDIAAGMTQLAGAR